LLPTWRPTSLRLSPLQPEINEVITIRRVQGNAVWYDGSCLCAKPGQLAWMPFPKARDLKFTAAGFKLYFPDGKSMSRYEWISTPVPLVRPKKTL
jgi:hypothetical protein